MTEKRVVAFIVEGPSEEEALGSVVKEFFSEEEVRFLVVHGDITTADYSSIDNIITKINELIDKVKQKYGYVGEDFLEIIHIVDTDGAFCKDAVRHAQVNSVKYFSDRIETNNVDYIKRRNKKKADILFKLYTTPSVNGIKYRVFYNSCNLEHVLYNELRDFSDEEKEILADDFSEEYEGKVDEFIKFISDKAFAVGGSYRDTWKFIERGTNSLNRFSNMHLIFKED